MSTLSNAKFLKTLPEVTIPYLPPALRSVQVRQRFSWLIQFHFGEPWLHYEVSKVRRSGGWEIGFHCEARDKRLNRFLLEGFRRHLFEIKDTLGDGIEAEMWDRGWTKIYEVVPPEVLTEEFQQQVGQRLAEIITCLHPFYVDLRGAVRQIYR